MADNKITNGIILNLFNTASSLDNGGKSGFILGSIKAISSIKDRIYLSKFRRFWNALEDNRIEMKDFIKKTQEQEDWQKVGESFLLVIDSFSSFDKCYYYGKVWISWLNKEVETDEFIKIIEMLKSIYITDLNHILHHSEEKGFTYLDEDRLYNCGFLKRRSVEEIEFAITPIDYSDHRSVAQQHEDNTENMFFHIKDHFCNPYIKSDSGKNLTNILARS